MGERLGPAIGQVAVVASARQRLAVIADQRPQQGELAGSGPRFQGLPLAQHAKQLVAGRAWAPLARAGRRLQRCGQRR
jgi:hypothetical protein